VSQIYLAFIRRDTTNAKITAYMKNPIRHGGTPNMEVIVGHVVPPLSSAIERYPENPNPSKANATNATILLSFFITITLLKLLGRE